MAGILDESYSQLIPLSGVGAGLAELGSSLTPTTVVSVSSRSGSVVLINPTFRLFRVQNNVTSRDLSGYFNTWCMVRKSLHHGSHCLGRREIILLRLAEIKFV